MTQVIVESLSTFLLSLAAGLLGAMVGFPIGKAVNKHRVKKEELMRLMAARLSVIRESTEEIMVADWGGVYYNEEDLFRLLKGLGYDVEPVIKTLTDKEIVQATQDISPNQKLMGVFLGEEHWMDTKELTPYGQ